MKKNQKNIKYDITLAISNAVKPHNTNIHFITKYSPEYVSLITQKK